MLRSYLIITGVLAVLAVAFPMLVVIGSFFILPGVVLEMAPTAFLWGCVYAGMLRLVETRWSGPAAVAASLTGAAAVMVLAPCLMQLEASMRLALARAPDVRPTTRIILTGHIRIETSDDAYYGQNCDLKCVATLLTPGVSDVTIASTPDAPHAKPPVRFSLAAHGHCGDHEDQPHLPTVDWQWGKQMLAERGCLLAEPIDSAPDFIVRAISRPAYQSGTWSPWTPVQIEEVSIIQGKVVLARRSQGGVDTLAIPLRTKGWGGFSDYWLGWATKRLGVKREDISRANPNAIMADYTSVTFPQH